MRYIISKAGRQLALPTLTAAALATSTQAELAWSGGAATYGCAKPTTTSTSSNTFIGGGTHDVTYSYVRFQGHDARFTGEGSAVVIIKINDTYANGDIYNLTFDHCVFATIDPGQRGNGIHFWNQGTLGQTLHHITFTDCWFEGQPRMTMEWNGRGGWWHHLTVDHCTFEGSGSQLFSADMSFDNNDPAPGTPDAYGQTYGILVDGVRRGCENISVTNCDFYGTGATVNGYAPYNSRTIEYRTCFPYAVDRSGGCVMRGNRFGRNKTAGWLNIGNAADDITIENNLFDWTYNPVGQTNNANDADASPFGAGVEPKNSHFSNNTYVLQNRTDLNLALFSGATGGDGNTFVGEHFTKSAGNITTCSMPFTNSTYTNCHFHLPKAVTFATDAVGTGCVFDNGYVNGTFT